MIGGLDEVGYARGGTLLAGPHCRRDRRSLEPADPARMLSAQTALRGVPVLARGHPPSAGGQAEETGALRRAAPDALSGIAQALRIHPDSEGPRPLSDHHVDRALGQRSHGGYARTADAAPTQELRAHVRSRDGLLGMRRAAVGKIRACASRTGRRPSLTRAREG